MDGGSKKVEEFKQETVDGKSKKKKKPSRTTLRKDASYPATLRLCTPTCTPFSKNDGTVLWGFTHSRVLLS